MFLHRNDQKMTTFYYFGPRILFVRPERTVGNNGLLRTLTLKRPGYFSKLKGSTHNFLT